MSTIVLQRYRPRMQPQLTAGDPHGGVNCSAYSLAMGIDAVSLGAVYVTGREVRAYSSEPVPDPHSPGLNLRQLVEVSRLFRVVFMDYTGNSFVYMSARVAAGYPVVLQGDSGAFLPKYQSNPFDGPHAVLITEASGRHLLVWNPLNKGPVAVPKTVVAKYAAGLAVGPGKIRFAGATHKMPDLGVVVK